MVISKNQLLLRDTQLHCAFWAWVVKSGSKKSRKEAQWCHTFVCLNEKDAEIVPVDDGCKWFGESQNQIIGIQWTFTWA